MITTDWEKLRQLLVAPELPPDSIRDFSDSYARRLISVLTDRACRYEAGDTAGLLRAVLRSRSVFVGSVSQLTLNHNNWLPDEACLRNHGIHATVNTSGVTVRASEWNPSWLDGVPDERVHRHRKNIYSNAIIESDPVVREMTGFETYRSEGQAAAVRAAATLSPGETLLINLPTSAGKSLAFEVCFGMSARRSETSVLVVPTTTLAVDQERRLVANGITTAAYHAGLSDARKNQIRQDIREGNLSVVITSPESLLVNLASSLRSVAERGRLSFVAIDEAHMVSGWGIEFRPEFQLMGGFIRQLIKLAPQPATRVRTLLLSATITRQSRQDLRQVFGEFSEVAAVSIRPEPEFWFARCTSKLEKFARVSEAIRHLPRPVIVYTSLRQEARELFSFVKNDCKVSRIALIRGGDLGRSAKGDSVLSSWAQGSIDIVVATSAFGLGIDNSDVRSVVHACLPESADRFYQEVGRAGRDGRNAVSLLLPSFQSGDLRVARKLSRKRLISADKALNRWTAMKIGRQVPSAQSPLSWYVDLEQPPVGVTQHSEANRIWNLRTLILMQAAGMVRLSTDERGSSIQATEFSERWLRVEICKPQLINDEDTWRLAFSKTRNRKFHQSTIDLRILRSLVRRKRRYADVFSAIYRPPHGDVASATGFDPITRHEGIENDFVPPVCPSVVGWRPTPLPPILEHLGVRVFSYHNCDSRGRLEAIVVGLVTRGIYDLELPKSLISPKLLREVQIRHPFPIVRVYGNTACRLTARHLRYDLPTFSLLVADESQPYSDLARRIRRRRSYRPDEIIIVSQAIAPTEAPGWSLADQINAMSLSVLEQAVFA